MQLTLPIYHTIEKKRSADKTILLGLNWYRNAYHFEQNKVKQAYHDLVHSQVGDSQFEQFTIQYLLYYKNSVCDPSNIIALVEKFLLDALQSINTIPNDTVKYHLGSSWKVVGQDTINPRVEVTITEINNDTCNETLRNI